MANWIHRTTFQFTPSNDPPLADQANWLSLGGDNPANITGSADPRDWTVVGDAVQLKAEVDLLPHKKADKIAAIDAKTRELISQGFTHAGKVFSLSASAQTNWLGVKNGYAAGLVYPYKWATKDDTEHYAFADEAEMITAADAAAATKTGHLNSGRDLKTAAIDAATIAALDLVVDNR